MSFPEYLRERLAEDYKNRLNEKLEEIKSGAENLKNSLSPSVSEVNQALRERLQKEISRIQETIEAELNQTQEKLSEQLEHFIQEYASSLSLESSGPDQLDGLIGDIVSNVPVPPPPPKEQSAELENIVELIRKMDQANTQSEILNILLNHISDSVHRAVLFVVKGDQAMAWASKGLGFDQDTGRVRQIKVDLSQFHLLREVVNTGEPAYGSADQFADNSQIFFILGSGFPQSALAFPIVVRGKIAGILYADAPEELSEKQDLPNLIFIASRCAGYAIDLLPSKGKTSAPKSTSTSAPPVEPPAPAPPVQAPSMDRYDDETARATVPIQVQSVQVEPDDEHATVIMPSLDALKQAAYTEQDQKLHDDAKRFARLLVSEIKLYNEAQVSAGRENKDLYDRLRDDIEKSRRMYQERVPEQIHTTTNYFYEELVRTLANGDPSLLGM